MVYLEVWKVKDNKRLSVRWLNVYFRQLPERNSK